MRPDAFVVFKWARAGGVDFLAEPAALRRGPGAAVAFQREGVLAVAVDVEAGVLGVEISPIPRSSSAHQSPSRTRRSVIAGSPIRGA